MKNINMKKMTFLLALSLVLVGCQTEKKEESKVESKTEQLDQTKAESEEQTSEETKEEQTDVESVEETLAEEVDKNLNEEEKNLDNIAKLFDKFNYKYDGKKVDAYFLSYAEDEKKDILNNVNVLPSYFKDDEFDVELSNFIENSESDVEKHIKKLAPIIEDTYGIGQKEFNDKVFSEYKNAEDKDAFIIQYPKNEMDLNPITVNSIVDTRGKLLTVTKLTNQKSDQENTKAFLDLGYKFAQKSKELMDPSKGYYVNIFQLNNDTLNFMENSDNTENKKEKPKTQADVQKSIDDALKNLDDMSKQLENQNLDDFNAKDLGISATYAVSNLSSEDLLDKNSDEVYRVQLDITGSYDIEFEKFVENLETYSSKFPKNSLSKLDKMKELMKKQHESRRIGEKDETNTLLEGSYVFTTNSFKLNPNDMRTSLILLVDKEGNLVNMPYFEKYEDFDKHSEGFEDNSVEEQ